MKTKILFLIIAFGIMGCNNETFEEQHHDKQNSNILSHKEINSLIKKRIDEKGEFVWNNENAIVIWSALVHGDSLLSVGYGGHSEAVLDAEKNLAERATLLQSLSLSPDNPELSIQTRSQSTVTKFIAEDKALRVVDIKIEDKKQLERLLANKNLRYVEPSGYQFFSEEEADNFAIDTRSSSEPGNSSGCGYSASVLAEEDYTLVPPGAKVPWNFYIHNIPKAWQYSTGKGITLAIIDTGISPEQKWLNQYFNDGYSQSRYIEKHGVYVDSWSSSATTPDGVDDRCGHGTKMASAATAPRNNDQLPVGIAYNANLVMYRAVKNVVIDSYHEQNGVAKALRELANNKEVKIISMSLGHIFKLSKVADAIKYAHQKGKIIFAAGGTSTSWTSWSGVIFPANMSETLAVTGIKEGEYKRCDICHEGNLIDFTVTMERKNSNKNVPVLSYYNKKASYVGGSSVATASMAGITALIWARHPSWTREQILQKMASSSQFYPTRNEKFGYGNVDVLKAVQ